MFKKIHILLLMPLLFLQGCIKDEPLEMEADIVAVHDVEDSFLMNPIITNNKVVIYVKPDEIDLTSYSMRFDLTKGATVSPDPESKRDFTKDVIFNVTSESGEYTKKYTVTIIQIDAIPDKFVYDNIKIDEDGNYPIFLDEVNGEQFENWSSGNPGFFLSLMFSNVKNPTPDMYPTTFTKGANGENALLLKTELTGALGAMIGAPIAAGNHFIGAFELNPSDPKASTRFGKPFNREPVSLEGHYKYLPGDKVTNSKLDPVNTIDSCDIYAVFYNRKELADRNKEIDYLDGYTIFDDPSVVAIARLEDGGATKGDEYVHFNIPFKYLKPVALDDIYKSDYNLAIVLTSSKYGDIFQGAVGSKLIVGGLKINTK